MKWYHFDGSFITRDLLACIIVIILTYKIINLDYVFLYILEI